MSMKNFYTILLGQTVSGIGGQIYGFSLSIYIYVLTGSAIMFAMSVALQMLPGIFLSPIAGVYVDKLNKKIIMIVCDSIEAIVCVLVLFLISVDKLDLSIIYISVFISSVVATFQQLAYSTVIPQIVPEESLGKVNGMVQLSVHGVAVFVPIVAAILMELIGIEGIICINLIAFTLSIVTLLMANVPSVKNKSEFERQGWSDDIREITDAWRYLKKQNGLLTLLYFFAISSFSIGFVQVLFRPLVIEMFDVVTLGYLMTIGGIGGLLGAVLMSVWGGPKKYINGVTGFMILAGISIVLCGIARTPVAMGIGVFLFSFAVPLITACSQTIWQRSIPKEMQGRVFSFRQVISTLFMPLGLVISPVIADYVIKPMLENEMLLPALVEIILGDLPARHMAALFIAMGGGVVFISLVTMNLKNIKFLECIERDVNKQTVS